MKVTKITVKLGITANAGNYQNIRPEVEVTAEVAEGESPQAVYAELAEFAREVMVAEVQQLIPEDPWRLKEALILAGVERTVAQNTAFPVAAGT